MLKCPDYVSFGPKGAITELRCKICGVKIGGVSEQLVKRRLDRSTSTWTERYVERFARFANYAEIKIEFEDGSSHVTNGCRSCLTAPLDNDLLQMLHSADIDMDVKSGNFLAEGLRSRRVKRLSTVRTDGEGII